MRFSGYWAIILTSILTTSFIECRLNTVDRALAGEKRYGRSKTRQNATIRDFHKKLVDAGKKAKVAITACMRKTIVSLNAMVKNITVWSPHLNQIPKHSCC